MRVPTVERNALVDTLAFKKPEMRRPSAAFVSRFRSFTPTPIYTRNVYKRSYSTVRRAYYYNSPWPLGNTVGGVSNKQRRTAAPSIRTVSRVHEMATGVTNGCTLLVKIRQKKK